jgi:transcription initiation factor IIE alpha subunit
LKKNKTSDWKLSETFYNVIKTRFSDLKKRLEKNLIEKSSLKFQCNKCKTIFTVEKAAHLMYKCSFCEDKPQLIEMKKEYLKTCL